MGSLTIIRYIGISADSETVRDAREHLEGIHGFLSHQYVFCAAPALKREHVVDL